MRKIVHAVSAVVVGALVCATPATASNLVVNGDFSAGNAGFSSGYSFSPGNCTPPAIYDVRTNPHDCHPLFASMGDHTTGSGNMMVVNGAEQPNVLVWGQTVSVLQNTTYFFSVWVATVFPASPAELDFNINGSAIGSLTAPNTTGNWVQFFATWFSGANTSAQLGLVNQNLAFSGNDFALDDIVLDTTQPGSVPEPGSWLLVGTALAALGRVRRRMRR